MIGAGKSSLATILGEELQVPVYYESVEDNPVLPLFYKDPNKYAFLLQIFFLNKRFSAMKKALRINNSIMDRSILEDSLLFHTNAELGRVGETKSDSDVVVDMYDGLLDNMLEEIEELPKKAPDLVIGIKASYETIIGRIEKRGRDYEQVSKDPSLESYYKLLIDKYADWFDHFEENNPHSNLIVIDGDKYDFIDKPKDRDKVISDIMAKLYDCGLIKDTDYDQYSNALVTKMMDKVADKIV